MTPEQIQKMAEGLPPSCIGKDHGEVVEWLANEHLRLQEQVKAMAAENVNIRHLLDMIGETGNANFGVTRLPTPATDAFIAEVKAQGVDEFATSLKGATELWHPVDAAEEFAASLRAAPAEEGV